jgi:hypothetical protein
LDVIKSGAKHHPFRKFHDAQSVELGCTEFKEEWTSLGLSKITKIVQEGNAVPNHNMQLDQGVYHPEQKPVTKQYCQNLAQEFSYA